MASQITSVSIVYSIICPGEDQRKHQSYASLAFVRGIHRWPVNSLHKGPVTRKRFPFDDFIMVLVPSPALCGSPQISTNMTPSYIKFIQTPIDDICVHLWAMEFKWENIKKIIIAKNIQDNRFYSFIFCYWCHKPSSLGTHQCVSARNM